MKFATIVLSLVLSTGTARGPVQGPGRGRLRAGGSGSAMSRRQVRQAVDLRAARLRHVLPDDGERQANVLGETERDGLCSACHVRLRPQVFQQVRTNGQIIQCDSCQRILYYIPPPPPIEHPVTHHP